MLRIGDRLLTQDGRAVPVEGVAPSGQRATVYNWRIAEYHTYYVSAAEASPSLWAHNADYNVTGEAAAPNGGHPDAARARELQEAINRLREQARQAQQQRLNPELIEDINRTIAQHQQEINRIFGIGQ
jgi:hypothetical protein